MADEKPVVPAEPVAVAPVAAEVVPAVVAEGAPIAEAPVAEVAPAVEVKPSLLETLESPTEPVKPEGEKPLAEVKPEAQKPAEEKPADVKPEEKPAEPVVETKPEEIKPIEPVKPETVQYKWDAPESIKFDDEVKTEVSSALDAFRADPTNPRPLFDQADKMMQRYAEETRRDQFRVFENTKRTWETQAMSDEEFGGNAWVTSKTAIARMRDQFVSSHPRGTPEWSADNNAFIEMLNTTGAGSHPAMFRYLHNVARRFDEPAVPTIADVKPVPQDGQRSGNPLHDNPRSRNLNSRQ